MWQKSDFSKLNSRGVLYFRITIIGEVIITEKGKAGGERGKMIYESGISQTFYLALRLLSPCS
jgi:hypothetical protein